MAPLLVIATDLHGKITHWDGLSVKHLGLAEAPGQSILGNLEQAVLNFVLNAPEAMLDIGKLVLATSLLPANERPNERCEIDLGCVLSIRDTGEGMDEATREKFFEPFSTTKRHGSGIRRTYGSSTCKTLHRARSGPLRMRESTPSWV